MFVSAFILSDCHVSLAQRRKHRMRCSHFLGDGKARYRSSDLLANLPIRRKEKAYLELDTGGGENGCRWRLRNICSKNRAKLHLKKT